MSDNRFEEATGSKRFPLKVSPFTGIISIIVGLFLISPVIITVIYSFNSGTRVTEWEGFSLKWYRSAFENISLWTSIKNTIIIAIANTIISTLAGTMAAYALARFRFRFKMLFRNLIYVPVILPEIIFGIALLSFFNLFSVEPGLTTVILSHVTFTLSFVTLIVGAGFDKFDFRLEEAALDLGAPHLTAFIKVVLPVIAPGVVSAAIFAFTLSVDDFIITFFTAGTGASTLPVKIYSMIKFSITPEINAISTILILLTSITLVSAFFLQKSSLFEKVKPAYIFSGFILIVGSLSVLSFTLGSREQVNVFIWTEYIDQKIITGFEEKYNIKVNLDYYSNNEEILAKLQLGNNGYDLIFPSDYMIDIMRRQNLIRKIDTSLIKNFKNIDPSFKKGYFDQSGDYHIPYAYGYMGIVYNKEKVKDPPHSWSILWDEKYAGRIIMLNDMREVFTVAYNYLGMDIEKKSEDDLEKALELLKKQKKLLKKYESSVIQEYLYSGEVWLAHTDIGTALKIMRNDPRFDFIIPREGTNIFIDNIAIPTSSPNYANAIKFIDYLIEPQNTALNIEKVMYPMPNREASRYLPEKLKKNRLLFPTADQIRSFTTLKDLGDFNKKMDIAWTKLMNY